MSKGKNSSTPNQANHKANQSNANRGSRGTNKTYDHVHGNRGGQLNPNRGMETIRVKSSQIN